MSEHGPFEKPPAFHADDLIGDTYLNFRNLDSPADGDTKNVGVGGWNDSGLPIVDFRGPDTIDFEKAKTINDAAWLKAIENGNFW